MTITTYAELKTALANWTDRSDLTSYLDEFIDLAEAYINTELRTREMEAVSDLSPTSNVYTVPTDYIEARRVVEKASPRRLLQFITPDAVEALYPTRSGGLSNNYTIIGTSIHTFPLSSNDIEFTYYQNVPALSDANTTNWLLTKSPNLYMHACKMQIEIFNKNNEGILLETQFTEAWINKMHELDNRANYSTAGITMSIVTP